MLNLKDAGTSEVPIWELTSDKGTFLVGENVEMVTWGGVGKVGSGGK